MSPKDHIRVLGVQIDTKLRWGPHIAKVQEKTTSQTLALGRITSSTWGASLNKAKLVYTTVVRPAILYGAEVWYGPQGSVLTRKATDRQLETAQNQCLRKILGAYKAVNARILEKEADIPPITTTLEKLTAKAVRRQATSIGGRIIQQARERIRNTALPGVRNRRQGLTPLETKQKWLQDRIPRELWPDTRENEQTQPGTNRSGQPRTNTWKQALRQMCEDSWERKWTAYLRTLPANSPQTPAQKDRRRNRSQLHETFSKATSALVTQIRTEKIGLNAFLTERRVPGYSATCPCGWQRQTAKHILLYCLTYADRREKLYTLAGTRDYRKMLVTPRGARAAASFIQATGLLAQFQLGIE